MPDSPLERAGGGSYDHGMEQRVTRLEEAMRDNTAAIARIDVAVAEIRAVLPSLASKAEIGQLATKAELTHQIAPLATKVEIAQLATKAELAQQIAPLATKLEIAQLATKEEMSQQISVLATKAELSQQIAQVATKADFAELKLAIATLSTRIEHEMATKADVAELRGYVKGLPTTWVMVTAIVAGQIGISGVIAGALLAAARMFLHN